VSAIPTGEPGASAATGEGAAGEPGALATGEGGGELANAGAGSIDGAPGKAGTVKVPLHSGHFINWPAYCSGTVSIFWQLGHSKFMVVVSRQ
jgi:hypothetical protein